MNINNLYKSYGKTKVFEDFSCEFLENEINFLVGKTGKGKTTLINIILGIEKIEKGNIKGLDNKNIGVVFQDNRLFENKSVLDNCLYVSKNINNVLANKLGLDSLMEEKVCNLSGGTKRKVSLLRALCYNYDILILDEPFVGLDKTTKQTVMDIICKINKTVIISTHDLTAMQYIGMNNHIVEV